MTATELRNYLEIQKAKTLWSMTNPSLRGNEMTYLKARLSAIEGKLASSVLRSEGK